MAAFGSASFPLERLRSTNYSYWKVKTEMLLVKEGVWHTVAEDPPAAPPAEWIRAAEKAKALLILALENEQLIHVSGLNTAKEVWNVLRAVHVRKTAGSKVLLAKRLYQTRYKEGVISALESLLDADLSMTYITNKLLQEAERRQEKSKQSNKENPERNAQGPMAYGVKRCYRCGSTTHLRRQCQAETKRRLQQTCTEHATCDRFLQESLNAPQLPGTVEHRQQQQQNGRTSAQPFSSRWKDSDLRCLIHTCKLQLDEVVTKLSLSYRSIFAVAADIVPNTLKQQAQLHFSYCLLSFSLPLCPQGITFWSQKGKKQAQHSLRNSPFWGNVQSALKLLGKASRMRMDVFLAAVLYLLSSYVPCHGTATSADGEDYVHVVGPALPPLKLGMSICALKADGGPCKALNTRYHFDIQTRQCEIFNYGGCEGNENNFLTLKECQETCIVPDLPKKKKKKKSRFKKEKPSYCLLENDPGICRGLISRYFYNKESLKCEKFQYGGCLGNQNNFHTLKECQNTCQDSLPLANSLQIDDNSMPFNSTNNSAPVLKQEAALLPSLCVMHMDRGLCKANEKRFYYNHTLGKCRPFSYSGCGGNENNFTTRKSCLRMCKKGFIKNQRQPGRMKIRRKRKKRPVELIDGEIVIERI
ncbi:tissue factor pathway inhibitor [Rhineura floridana]|uniref:tissue factor pathway inhibitor n=1 Tax=Rhineura floridana TaxID=261503 RepID=UPI002AC82B89|nr:tissue factor pathway inhibitor [Rhineura floridana]